MFYPDWKIALRNLPTPIGLVGFGKEGQQSWQFFHSQGVEQLYAFDRDQPKQLPAGFSTTHLHVGECWHEGAAAEAWLSCRTLIRSPGVRPDHPSLQLARQQGVHITSATACFCAWAPVPLIGITGTMGKGTTVALIAEAFRACGVVCHVGGNFGQNPLGFLPNIQPEDAVVLEMSSFQLMDISDHQPQIAILLRTTVEHLDWHKDVQEYRLAKSQLLKRRDQVQIVCAEGEGTHQITHLVSDVPPPKQRFMISGTEAVSAGIGVEAGQIWQYDQHGKHPVPALAQLRMPGGFNLENAAAAWLAVQCWWSMCWRWRIHNDDQLLLEQSVLEFFSQSPGTSNQPQVKQNKIDEQSQIDALRALQKKALQAIAQFAGLPHRLQWVGQIALNSTTTASNSVIAIDCYNDSYATRPDATMGAIAHFREPLALIVGGSEKHADFTLLAEALVRHRSLQLVVLIGQTAPRLAATIEAAFQASGPQQQDKTLQQAPTMVLCDSLELAIEKGVKALSKQGGVLLLSPACASFGMFENYTVRGEQFQQCIQAHIQTHSQ